MKRTIFITGSSSGIGKATAKFFHERGWNVAATMRAPEKETELTKLNDVLVTRLDVQDKESIQSAVAEGIARFGSIDVVVNNAGYGAFGVLEAASDDTIHRQFAVNVFGVLDVTRAVLPHFRKKRAGMFINITSIGGKRTFPLATLYHGSKFAIEGISEALSFEFAEIGVKTKIVEPGAIRTDFGTRSLDFYNDESITEYQGLVNKMLTAFGNTDRPSSEAIVVAQVIYDAATDGTDTLRYTAGDDAAQIMAARKAQPDDVFLQGIKQEFGL